jgi:hypothetical protein
MIAAGTTKMRKDITDADANPGFIRIGRLLKKTRPFHCDNPARFSAGCRIAVHRCRIPAEIELFSSKSRFCVSFGFHRKTPSSET